ncbi:MAG: hypothetical protein HOV81_45910 [Kofleriaceae bacterium]|nr:hypothetical protein [Kofleriaceae bacterium]
MTEIKFELTLPDGPRSPVVIVAGGADGNRDDVIDNAEEVKAFVRDGNTWSRKQEVDDRLAGMRFIVTFLVGQNVRWELTIKDAGGHVLYRNQNTTVLHTGEVRWHLP